VDGLPLAEAVVDRISRKRHLKWGFDLGYMEKDIAYLNNYFDIKIHTHVTNDKKHYRVVGATVDAYSLKTPSSDCNRNNKDASPIKPLRLSETLETKVEYMYSVSWVASNVTWGTRWDQYLLSSSASEPKIHWFSLVNSVVVVLFLSGMVAMVLIRALHKDIARYNQISTSTDPEADAEAIQEEIGWKLVHGDVFRPPAFSWLLSVLVGSGAQMIGMATVTLVFAVLGFLSPSSRGSLTTVMIVMYICFGSTAGYYSARLHKLFNETFASSSGLSSSAPNSWKRNVVLTAFLFPGTIFTVFIIQNFFLIGARSSGAVPFGTMLALFSLWFLISAPLCALGAYFGFKKAVRKDVH
jgi:transmembrane 9 superfamily protein 2/4